MKTGLIWGGGGARGIIQVGYAKALAELNVQFDLSIGSSVGSLNASLFHTRGAAAMEEIWRSIRNKSVYRFAPWRTLTKSACFYDVEPLRRLITTNVNLDTLRDNPKELWINSTNVATWDTRSTEVHTLGSEKDIVEELMASAAAPIAFPNVNNLVDAGLTANYSVGQAVGMGCDRVIVLGVSVPEFSQIKSIVDAFECVASVPEWAQLTAAIKETNRLNSVPGYRNIEVIVVTPPKPTGINLLDFDLKGKDRSELIAYGYSLAMSALGALAVR